MGIALVKQRATALVQVLLVSSLDVGLAIESVPMMLARSMETLLVEQLVIL
jgi:hypothetical protein